MLSHARLMLMLGLCGIAAAQTPNTRTDIDANSLSRFPIVQRSEMKTDADRAAYDYVVGTAPGQLRSLGPAVFPCTVLARRKRLNASIATCATIALLDAGCSSYAPSSARGKSSSNMNGPATNPRRYSSGSARRLSTRSNSIARSKDYLKTRLSSFRWAARSCASTGSTPKSTRMPSSCSDGKVRWSCPSPWVTM